jgi:polar amino acid transport system permease protein
MIFQGQPSFIEQLISIFEYWDLILAGLIMTLWLYLWALIMGFFLGLIFAILRQYGGRILTSISTGYIEIIRGTPLLAQLLLLYYLPNRIVFPWTFTINLTARASISLLSDRTLIAIIALGLNSSAYQAEYLRGAMMSVGTEQLIAAQSVGMSRFAGIRRVILPQALRRAIPAWSNEAAYLPKYTVVVYFIAVLDLFAQAYIISFATFAVILTYIIVAIIFLIMITFISKGLDVLHKRTAIPGV